MQIIFVGIKLSNGSTAMYETWRIGTLLYVELESFNRAIFAISLLWKAGYSSRGTFV